MENITLHSLEHLKPEDKEIALEQIKAVERSAWPDELEASREKFLSRLEIFPEGFLVAEVDGVIKGMATAQLTTYDPGKKVSWNTLTDNGYIKSHNKNGDALYVISVAVSQDVQGLGLGSKLVEAQKDLARKMGKKYVFLGARVPGYDEYCKENGDISIESYIDLKNEKGEVVDPELRFYIRNGFMPAKIVPNFEPDPSSRDYGVVMLWENS